MLTKRSASISVKDKIFLDQGITTKDQDLVKILNINGSFCMHNLQSPLLATMTEHQLVVHLVPCHIAFTCIVEEYPNQS